MYALFYVLSSTKNDLLTLKNNEYIKHHIPHQRRHNPQQFQIFRARISHQLCSRVRTSDNKDIVNRLNLYPRGRLIFRIDSFISLI